MLQGVVPSEMFASSPPEALKARIREQVAALTDDQRAGLLRLTQREALEFERGEGRVYDYMMAAFRRFEEGR